jgi:hypothetical protein
VTDNSRPTPVPGRPGSMTHNQPMGGRYDGRVPAPPQAKALVINRSGKQPEKAVHLGGKPKGRGK